MPYVRSILGQRIRASFARSGFAYPSGPAKPSYLITEDAGTVAHVYFDGSKLVDSKVTWAMHGTVPQVAASSPKPAGAGPFSDSNYYYLGTGVDVLDFSGDFTAIFVFTGALSAGQVLYSNGAYNAAGIFLQSQGTGSGINLVWSSSGPANHLVLGAGNMGTWVSVLCVGRSGTTWIARMNAGSAATSTSSAYTVPSARVAYLGRYDGTGNGATGVTLIEAMFSSTGATDAAFSAAIGAIHTKLAISNW